MQNKMMILQKYQSRDCQQRLNLFLEYRVPGFICPWISF